MLEARPIELNDFSGGVTENFLQADPRRYEKGDNFLITVDKKLEERPPFVPLNGDGSAISGNTDRIGGFFSFLNQKQLMNQTGQNINYLALTSGNSKYWTKITGAAGNPVIEGGDSYSQVSYGEFQKQIYLVSDGLNEDAGVQPSKIFRNESDTWTGRTAGLPRSYVAGNYTNSALLAACISLANAIRTSLVSHFGDAVNTSYTAPTTNQVSSTQLHINVDKYSLCYLVTQSFLGSDPEQPSTIPTAQAACTSEATLYTLITAMNLAYTHHSQDANRNAYGNTTTTLSPYYHQDQLTNALDQTSVKTPKGPHVPLQNSGTPSTLLQAAAMLDDLYQKWNWHRKSVNTHSPTNDPLQYNVYAVAGSKIGPIRQGNSYATVTSDYTDVYNFVNNIKYIYNRHATNLSATSSTAAHERRDNYANNFGLECTLADATNLDDAYLMTYWLRSLYYLHDLDTRVASYVNISFAATAGSASLTSVIRTDTGAAYTIPLNSTIFSTSTFQAIFNQYNGNNAYVTAKVTASGSGTATIDRTAISSTTYTAQATLAQYHASLSSLGVPFTGSTVSLATAASALANAPYTVANDTTSWLSLAQEMWTALNAHRANNYIHISVADNAPAILAVPYPNFFTPAVAKSSYAFYFSDEYTVGAGGIDYLVVGNPVVTDELETAISYPTNYTFPSTATNPNANTQVGTVRSNVLTNLPVLVNTLSTNYNLATVKLNIYKTLDGGNTYYKLAAVANGTKTYTDTVADTLGPADLALENQEILYTSGGVQGHDQPAKCKFMHIFNGTPYFGACEDSGQFFPGRVLQGITNVPDAAPATNYTELDDQLTGLSSTKANLLAFCKNSVYRISGGFDLLGQGSLLYDRISDKMGCINQTSIVQTEIGVFYAGTDGFYYTDGFQTIKVSIDLDNTYQACVVNDNQKRNVYGTYDENTRRVWWALRETPTGPDNDVLFVLHLAFGIKPSGAFTIQRNYGILKPSSLVFQDSNIYLGYADGTILQTDPLNKMDYNSSLGTYVHIPYWYRSSALDFGTTFMRKWLTKMHIVGKNIGNALLQPGSLRDLNQYQQNVKPSAQINYISNCWWGNSKFVWGATANPSFIWKYDGKLDVWRRFPSGNLRSDFMQVEIRPAFGIVYSSSQDYDVGTHATVDRNSLEVVLNTPQLTTTNWPGDVSGMYISFSNDNYATQYQIDTFTHGTYTDEITISDPNNTLVSGTYKWEIQGYRKQQKMHLSSIDIHYRYLGDKNQSYPGAKSNAGPGNLGGNP